MKSETIRWHRLTICGVWINLMVFASIQLYVGSSKIERNERTLSRRRRYLIFPEGSSLQIVYDTYHPVVDYTNLLVVGITGALAWELPSKPVYPEEELQEIYKNGSLPLLRRNDGIEINKTTASESDKLQHYLSYATPIKDSNTMANFYSKLMNGEAPSRKNFYPSYDIRHHSIRPTFRRKRTTSDGTIETFHDEFHSKLHMTSRCKLYERLEKFIDTTGYDGKDCILKALCETGQIKRHEQHRSFLGEIMRAIFSLPAMETGQKNLPNELYGAAYTEKRNCSTLYPKCSENLWNSSFH